MVNFTPEQIQQMKEGIPLSGTLDEETGCVKASVFTPASHTAISGYGTDIRPQILNEDGTKVGKAVVSRPSGKTLETYNKADEKKKIAEAKTADLAHQEREAMSPQSLHSQVQYLTRSLKKLQKELIQLKKTNECAT